MTFSPVTIIFNVKRLGPALARAFLAHAVPWTLRALDLAAAALLCLFLQKSAATRFVPSRHLLPHWRQHVACEHKPYLAIGALRQPSLMAALSFRRACLSNCRHPFSLGKRAHFQQFAIIGSDLSDPSLHCLGVYFCQCRFTF